MPVGCTSTPAPTGEIFGTLSNTSTECPFLFNKRAAAGPVVPCSHDGDRQRGFFIIEGPERFSSLAAWREGMKDPRKPTARETNNPSKIKEKGMRIRNDERM